MSGKVSDALEAKLREFGTVVEVRVLVHVCLASQLAFKVPFGIRSLHTVVSVTVKF